MLVLFLVLLGIALIVAYVQTLNQVPHAYFFLIVMGAIAIVEFIIVAIISKRFRPNKQQQAKLAQASADDLIATEKMHKEEFAALDRQISRKKELEAQLAKTKREAQYTDILSSQDLNTETVEYLINKLENHRAESIPEALRMYDAHRSRMVEIQLQSLREQAERERQVQQLWDDFNRDMQAIQHRKKMERLEEQRVDELKRIREELEKS